MKNASLTIVGTGIKFLSHLTTEAKAYIEQSDKVLYLVNDPAMKEWISKTNSNSESLDSLYTKHALRRECYQEITHYILENLRLNQHVCAVFYGHPTVFAQPGIDAIKQARNEGYQAKVLPGISAEDCLFADLLINPGSSGCQSFEATDFLLYQRKFDPSCHLILWQASMIGMLGHDKSPKNAPGIPLLVEYLNQFYPVSHQVFLYEAAQYPSFEPRITTITLAELVTTEFSRISTLYIPPAKKSEINEAIFKSLNLDIDTL